MVNLYPLKKFTYPILAECINPDVFQEKTSQEIEMLKIWEGNKQKKLGDLFKIEKTKQKNLENEVIIIKGDVKKVRRIGAHMKTGEIRVYGDVGMHLGEEMEGGKIVVHGNSGGWTGSMMKNGKIEIHGNADDYLGAPYRGTIEGMNGGTIIVYGNVGNEAGSYMRNATIKIFGNAGQFAGYKMHSGTIYIQKDPKKRIGACMTGGKIVVGGFLESILPTFTIDNIKKKVKIEKDEKIAGPFYLFLGDLVENGKGKLYVHKEKNPHLRHYEKLL
jgi:formylmethanofuran dehydrogenase subunit C